MNERIVSSLHNFIFYIEFKHLAEKILFVQISFNLLLFFIESINLHYFQVKYATQVLSNSVSAAMNTYIATENIESSAAATSEYLKRFNDILDWLNRMSSKDPVLYRRPLHSKSKSITFLKGSQEWLQNLRELNKRKGSFIVGFMPTF